MPSAGNEFQHGTSIEIASQNQLRGMIVNGTTLISRMYSEPRTLHLREWNTAIMFQQQPSLPFLTFPGFFSLSSSWSVFLCCVQLCGCPSLFIAPAVIHFLICAHSLYHVPWKQWVLCRISYWLLEHMECVGIVLKLPIKFEAREWNLHSFREVTVISKPTWWSMFLVCFQSQHISPLLFLLWTHQSVSCIYQSPGMTRARH